MLTVTEVWENVFQEGPRAGLESLLPDVLRARRWFGGKARTIRAVEILEAIPMARNTEGLKAYLALLKVTYLEGKSETYILPLTFAGGERAAQVQDQLPHAVVARLRVEGTQDGEGLLYDALWDKGFSLGLLEAIATHRNFTGGKGKIEASCTHALGRLLPSAAAAGEPAIMKAEQSNTSVVYGDRLILKLFRRPEEGINPDLEIGRFLTEGGFSHIPPVAGAIEYRPVAGAPHSLAILQGFVANQGDAWGFTLDALDHYFARLPPGEVPTVPGGSLLVRSRSAVPPVVVQECIGPYLKAAALLGQRTAELHLALAREGSDPAFAPEPFTESDRHALAEGMLNLTEQTFRLLRPRLAEIPRETQDDARAVLAREGEIRSHVWRLREQPISAMRIRCHGDFHLGQVLRTGQDFIIIDFEGEPARPLAERRRKDSPLRDVAGMVRSFHYAAHAALVAKRARAREAVASWEGWARLWYVWVAIAFLQAYFTVTARAPFLPATSDALEFLFRVFLLEKAVYELGYELNNRPDWVKIPLRGIRELLEVSG
jgi:trehalose synthase-fused probable maltokinase